MENNKNIIKLSKGIVNNTNYLVLGIFFLAWAINGYFIGGNTLKLIILGISFFLISYNIYKLPKDKQFYNFAFLSGSLLVIYWVIAVLQNQYTITGSIVIFDIICYLIFITGFLVSKNLKYFNKVSKPVILIIVSITILGTFMYMKSQSKMNFEAPGNLRQVADESAADDSINVIGIAYANAIIFFVLYHFFTFYLLNKWIKFLILIGMLSTFVIIFSTESRGAIIYIVLILILCNLYKIKSIKSISKTLFYIVILSIVAVAFYKISIQQFPVLENKIEGAIIRFQNLSNITENINADQSSYERSLKIKFFYDHIQEILLIGQKNYKPYPHNQFIEILMRWGIFFGLPLIIASLFNFSKAILMLIKTINIHPLIHIMILVFLFSFFQSMSSLSLEINRIFWMGLGVLIGTPYKVIRKHVIKSKSHDFN